MSHARQQMYVDPTSHRPHDLEALGLNVNLALLNHPTWLYIV